MWNCKFSRVEEKIVWGFKKLNTEKNADLNDEFASSVLNVRKTSGDNHAIGRIHTHTHRI